MNQYQVKLRNKKSEQFIRDLIKVEENNKCFDCTSNKITHVNLSINTFICNECESLLREINHRIKSISQSTFSPEELYNLQNGGNKKAKKIWLAKWKDSYEELNHNKHDIEMSKKFIRYKYVNKKWFVAPNEIEIDPPKVEKEIKRQSYPKIIETKSIEIKSKNKRESIISKSLNELEIFNRHKSNKRLSKQSPIRSPITSSDTEIDILNQTYINLQNINPYLPLDDEDDEDNSRTLSMDTSNITTEKSKFKRASLDFFNLNKTLGRKTDKNNNNNNKSNKRFSLTTKIPINNNIKNKENINNNYHHNNDFYENDISNNKQYKFHNYFNQNNYDNYSKINSNDNNKLNDVLNNKYNTKTESKEKLKRNPVYAPRSSSLLNKALIEKVCNTKNCYFIDNKKVYCYDNHSKQIQMQY